MLRGYLGPRVREVLMVKMIKFTILLQFKLLSLGLIYQLCMSSVFACMSTHTPRVQHTYKILNSVFTTQNYAAG